MRACLLIVQVFLSALFVLLSSGRAQAYPWMIKHGYTNCATCHADPSGGELLTAYGRVLSEEVLSTHYEKPHTARQQPKKRWALSRAASSKNAEDVKSPPGAAAPGAVPAPAADTTATDVSTARETAPASEAPEAPDEPLGSPAPDQAEAPSAASAEQAAPSREGHEFFQPFFGAFGAPESLLLGGSVRVATLYRDTDTDRLRVFPMQIDLYGDYKFLGRFHVGGSLGVAKVAVGSPHARAAQITTNQGDQYNLLSRTHYVRYDFGDGAHSVSVGRLNLPFGIRMSEHVMWVRSETATDRESDQEHGAALNMNFDAWRFEAMAIAGNYQLNPDKLRKRGYSAYAELNAWNGGVLGISSLVTHAGADMLNPGPIADTRQAHGVFTRASLGHELVLMAEADLLLHTQTKPGYVGFAQLDFEALSGFHLLGTGEVLDTGYPKVTDDPRTPGIGKPKLGGWLSAQWFFVSHFDFRLDAIVRRNEPFQLLGQIHVYL